MRYLLATTVIIFATEAPAANRLIEMQMECQQNIMDGRILVANGDMLPTDARYKIKTYRPTKNIGNGWTTGPCVLTITKGASG